MKKRNLFAEMMEGVTEMGAQREGKITLRQHAVAPKPAPEITAEEILAVRNSLKMSQPVFARHIRTTTSSLRNWEQSKARPNPQAALLIKLVAEFPDMVDRLEAV